MRKFVLFAATGAGSGYAPVAPGTAGSVVGVGLWGLCVSVLALPPEGYLVVVIGLTVLAVWTAGEAEKIFGRRDDGRITVDEVAGQMLALVALPAGLGVALAAFLLFRLFDIWKPWPTRAMERLPGGMGVVADDLMAGLYANLVSQLLWRAGYLGGGSA